MLSTTHLSENIPIDKFLEVLTRYPATLKAVADFKVKKRPANTNASKTPVSSKSASDDSLVGLEEWKDGIREVVVERSAKKGNASSKNKDAYLTKPELRQIVQWKLKRGVFRPSLPGLVASNPDDLVESTTRTLFEAFPPNQDPVTCDPAKEADDDACLKSMLEILTKPLKGVGPATATAITSSVFPAAIPFFSDEAFRWIMWSDLSKPSKGGGVGWDRKIDYNLKEYLQYCHGVWGVVSRLRGQAAKQKLDISIGAAEVEKVGWTLGQQHKLGKVKSEAAEKDDGGASVATKPTEPTKEPLKKASKSKTLHTGVEKDTPEEPTELRRSKRTKK